MKSRRGIAAILGTFLVVAAAAVAAVGFAEPASAADYRYIQNAGSGMCLQPPPGTETDIAVQLVQQPCVQSVAQRWTLVSLGNNVYSLVSLSNGACMDSSGPDANRTPVETWPCQNDHQRWILRGGTFDIRANIGSHRCLDVSGGSLEAGAPIQIYACTNDPLNNNRAQAWFIRLPDMT